MALDKVNNIGRLTPLIGTPTALPKAVSPPLDKYGEGGPAVKLASVGSVRNPLWTLPLSGEGGKVVANAATSTMPNLRNHRAELVERIQGMIQNVE